MATEFKDHFGVVESDTYGIKYAVISMLGIAKVV